MYIQTIQQQKDTERSWFGQWLGFICGGKFHRKCVYVCVDGCKHLLEGVDECYYTRYIRSGGRWWITRCETNV